MSKKQRIEAAENQKAILTNKEQELIDQIKSIENDLEEYRESLLGIRIQISNIDYDLSEGI